MVTYAPAHQTNARKTLLPPQKRYDNDGAGKREYRDNLIRQPRTFHRQNGDCTHFQDLKVANNLIAARGLSPTQSKALFK